ncbi:MAG: hypothetical protein QM733_03570 [Ilumatobacteraceae bacterium]
MPPPKRKTTGRVTPKGTRPGQSSTSAAAHATDAHSAVHSSSRYTPPIPQSVKESPRWVPILMLVLIGAAVVAILLRYIVWTDTNTPVIVGLLLLLSGLFVATKWH